MAAGMTVKDWLDLASVFRAGAERAFGWSHNSAMQIHAEVLETQADRCDEIARERDGNPLIASHNHYHYHGTGRDRSIHLHPHEHLAGKTEHDGHWHEPRRPDTPQY